MTDAELSPFDEISHPIAGVGRVEAFLFDDILASFPGYEHWIKVRAADLTLIKKYERPPIRFAYGD